MIREQFEPMGRTSPGGTTTNISYTELHEKCNWLKMGKKFGSTISCTKAEI